ncbi:hypothetical protein Btru_012262, partial [Bulinus truncatus]
NDEGEDTLAEIRTASEMWEYLTEVLLSRIAPDGVSNNLPEATYLLGLARLRLARVKPESESIRNVYSTEFCIQSIEYGIEERNTFVNTWSKVYEGNSDDLEDSPYVYKSADQLNTVSFIGQHGTYSGGGYVVNISREDFNLAMQSLEKVQDSDWLDQHTRCIILEFTVYNPSSDLFTNVILAFEFDVTGGIFPYYSISAARFYLDSARKDDWLQIAEGITGICVVFYTVLEIYIMIEKGLTNYLKNFWNLLEIAVLSLSYVVGVLYLLRLMAYMDAINTFNTYGHARFIDFQTVFYRNFLFNTSMGVLGALAIFKMLKVITSLMLQPTPLVRSSEKQCFSWGRGGKGEARVRMTIGAGAARSSNDAKEQVGYWMPGLDCNGFRPSASSKLLEEASCIMSDETAYFMLQQRVLPRFRDSRFQATIILHNRTVMKSHEVDAPVIYGHMNDLPLGRFENRCLTSQLKITNFYESSLLLITVQETTECRRRIVRRLFITQVRQPRDIFRWS